MHTALYIITGLLVLLAIAIIGFLFIGKAFFSSVRNPYKEVNGQMVYQVPLGRASPLAGSDPASFKQIGSGNHAKDKNQVYYQDLILPKADPTTFEEIDSLFSKDKNQVYLGNKVIEGADPNTFTILGSLYSKDIKNVYFTTKSINGADRESFKIISNESWPFNFNHFAKDRKQVYCADTVLVGADSSTFTPLTTSGGAVSIFGADSSHIFNLPFCRQLDADRESFMVVDEETGKDKEREYTSDS